MQRSRPSLRYTALELLGASFVVLFQELALIRWLPVEVRVAAYFPNLILIGAFLGLGVGALKSRSPSLLWVWPPALLGLVAVAWAMGSVAFTANGVTEHLWLLYNDLPEDAPVLDGIHLPLVLLFSLSALTFVPLGQFVGSRLETFRERSSALWGYSFDLGGSLLGVVAFAAVSWSGISPVIWFAAPLAVGLAVLAPSIRLRCLLVGCAALTLALVHSTSSQKRFSPYYALETARGEGDSAVIIRANGSLHQVAVNLVGEGDDPYSAATLRGYRYPYERLGRPIRKALVLGAGSGNDVAVLLDRGAQQVHAVEIDPEILRIGREVHPNTPYADPRVVVHVTDARSFLNETEQHFDVITFGTLDSMTRLAAMSNVRLDNFVYTLEALAAARDRLTPDGGLILYFMVGEQYIADHLTALLAHTFGAWPQVHRGEYRLFNTVFMAGPAFAGNEAAAPGADAWFLQEDLIRRTAPSDDWPYLYLPARAVGSFYVSMMATLAVLAVLAILWASPQMRVELLRAKGVDIEMLLYGFGFLLLETKFVTAMNLLWGATWLTSAVVFGSILLVVLAGTLLTEVSRIPWPAAAAGVVGGLLAVYLIPLDLLLGVSPLTRLLLSALLVGAPVLFASICFAARFRIRPAADLAFGWNLLGAVLGGLAEFLSMAFGFRALTLLAAAAYLGAFLSARKASVARTSD
jgi:hypothetical protein